MMNKYLNLVNIVLLFLIVGCAQKKELDIATTKEINGLYSDKLQKDFLEEIINDDQRIRNEEQSILVKKGIDSKDYKDFIDEMMVHDYGNLLKIECYLKRYGHPSIRRHGEKAVYCPWLIIHHSSELEPREVHFKILYDAYLSKDLDESLFSSYLERFYWMKFGKSFESKGKNNKVLEIIESLKMKCNMDGAENPE